MSKAEFDAGKADGAARREPGTLAFKSFLIQIKPSEHEGEYVLYDLEIGKRDKTRVQCSV